jgi:YHS domain-containing protein
MRLLKDLAGSGDRAVIAVSQRPADPEVADRVLWLEDGKISDIGQLARDPVCGMSVEVERAVAFEYQGRTFHFCSRGCSWEFHTSPEEFTGSADGARDTD